ncbi:MAG: hypothetical protein IJU23_00100 [Proteobacteria bacterium]|nr:hypothetical protein [Pseudomonadota bacterium]
MRYIRILPFILASCLTLACADGDNKTTNPDDTNVPDTTDTTPTNPTPTDPTPTTPPPTNPTPTDPTPSQPLDNGEVDPCASVKCTSGTCSEGVCVTAEMKNYHNDQTCDPETFVEFCDGNVAVYCDHGVVMSGACDEKCVVYSETYFGLVRQQAGCVDGGACNTLNELKRTCSVVQGMGQVLTTACQKTTRGTLNWVSVNGYYCAGLCDGNGEKCALTEGECDPYDASNYSCERHTLNTCYLDSNLIARKRTDYCDDKCISVNGISMCGFSCDKEGDRSNRCVYADSLSIQDSGEFVCTKTDSGALYSIWNGEYSLCDETKGCNASTGVCN